MANKGVVWMTYRGYVHPVGLDKAGASKGSRGNIPADMVDVRGLVGRTRRQMMFACNKN